jgi:hypothetical protein
MISNSSTCCGIYSPSIRLCWFHVSWTSPCARLSRPMQGMRRKHSCSSRNSPGATYRRKVCPLRRTQKVSAFRNLPRQALSFPLEEARSHCRRQDGIDRCFSGPHNRRSWPKKKWSLCSQAPSGFRCSRVRLLRSSLSPFLPVLSWPSSRS